MKLTFQEISFITQSVPAVKMMRSDNFPLIASFLNLAFKEGKRNEIPENDMIMLLSDYIFSLKQSGEGLQLSDNSRGYLERWTNEGFLRKYYPSGSDIPVFQLTPASEKAFQWLADLEKKEFVGTESRLLKIFELMKEIVYKSSEDPQKRLAELESRKREIESEIEKVKAGELQKLDDTQIKERFYELNDTAGKLLSDFREIEYNFRSLDRQIREKQLGQELKKGRMLEDIFDFHDLMWNTDQGKSFKAFWEFLMSPEKQEEFDELSERLLDLPAIAAAAAGGNAVEGLKADLIDAGDKVNRTTHGLIEQLRKYLDSRVRIENRRMMEIIKEIKSSALGLKENPPAAKDFFTFEDRPLTEMIMERPLFKPPKVSLLSGSDLDEGEADLELNLLYSQHYIDIEQLQQNIRTLLAEDKQVSLLKVIESFPVTRGVSEILAYLEIASGGKGSVINENEKQKIEIENTAKGKRYNIEIPEIIFVK